MIRVLQSSVLNFYIMLLICLSGLIAVIETVPSLRGHKDVWYCLTCRSIMSSYPAHVKVQH